MSGREDGTKPMYGDLVDIFERFEGQPDVQDLLFAEVCKCYPNVTVSCPSRFYDTIRRLVAPTRPSLHGEAKLTGSPLASYRRRVWQPRVRNTGKTIIEYCVIAFVYLFIIIT